MSGKSCAVSIIVPCYNSEAFLGECVESVLGQSLSDFELIIIDDGSQDGSNKIAQDFAQQDQVGDQPAGEDGAAGAD